MTTYKIDLNKDQNLMTVAFGDPATNAQIVVDAQAALNNLPLGGDVLKITGPASLPVAFVLAHKLSHMYNAIAVFDPKLQKFVVCVSHSPQHQVGALID